MKKRKSKLPPKPKRKRRPPTPYELQTRLPGGVTTRLAVVVSGMKPKLPAYVRIGLGDAPLEPVKLPPLPPAPPLDAAEVLRLARENPGFPEDPSDHEDPPFYYDPASGTYFP